MCMSKDVGDTVHATSLHGPSESVSFKEASDIGFLKRPPWLTSLDYIDSLVEIECLTP